MKTFENLTARLALCALVCVSLAACSDKEDNTVPEDDLYVTLDPESEVELPAEGGSATVAVTTNYSSWEVVSGEDWCVVEAGDYWFTVSAEANETGQTRTAQVDLTANGGLDGRAVQGYKTITVTQESVEDQDDDDDDDDDVDEDTHIDLSAAGTSNCYLVSAAGDYRFDATVRGNGAETDGLDAPAALEGSSAELVWQSAKGLVADVAYADGSIEFTINGTGNALIALCDEDGGILWSWHIWYPEQTPAALHTATGYDVLDINLGAMRNSQADPASYGTLYQWGRKDPLPGGDVLTGDTSTLQATVYDIDGNEVEITNSSWYDTSANTIEYAIAHPTVCLSNYAQYSTCKDWLADGTANDALWGNPSGGDRDEVNAYPNKGSKSFYDPCPVGYRVPPADVFHNFTTSGGYAWTYDDMNVADNNGDGEITADDFNYGWVFNLDEGVTSYFPAAARYDGSYGMFYGSVSGLWGSFWGNAPYTTTTGGLAFCVLSFQSTAVSPTAGGSRADAYSIRCIVED